MYKFLRNKCAVVRWRLKGKPAPPPHNIKQLCIKEFQQKFNVNVFIETGTYLGDMVEAQKNNFNHIYSIELSKELYEKARERFKEYDNINILQGNSGVVLKRLVSEIKERAIFWLDGHYSGGITARGGEECPIMKELDAIFSSNIDHILLIDDARLFDGKKADYPSIKELIDYILIKYKNSYIEIKFDIIRIKLKK